MTMRHQSRRERAAATQFTMKPLARSVQFALLPGVIAGLLPVTLPAAPTGGQVQTGIASIAQTVDQSVTTINQQSQRAAIDWQSFNVGKNQLVQFNQPGASASTLNRIFDQNPSQIFGQVKANGQVVLMNPNGVFFKPGAKVNVGSLVAGAMRIGVDDFMRGTFTLEALKNAGGRVVNEGTIEAANGGDVTLVGKSVANHGVIVATAGRVNLVAGEQVTVDFDGDGLLRFAVDKAVLENAQAIDDQIENTGDIAAEGGDVLITASALDGVFRNAINNSGVVKAGRVENRGGKVMLVGMGPGASVLNTGQVNASAATATDAGGVIEVRAANIINDGAIVADGADGNGGNVVVESSDTTLSSGLISAASDGGQGGQIKVLGDRVGLVGSAAVDASGGQGGGEVLVGGAFQGNDPYVRNATQTVVSTHASISADAVEAGDGGTVVVWADGRTTFKGNISATGGSSGGDGGDVEVSGKQDLAFSGGVDASAVNGRNGTLLLDPGTLTIVPTDTATSDDPGNGGNPNVFDDALLADAEIVAATLIGLGDISLTLQADDDIIFAPGLGALAFTQTGASTILLQAGQDGSGDILMNGTDLTTAGGQVTFQTPGLISAIGAINLAGGTLTLNIGTTAAQNAGDVISGATALTKLGAGTLTLNQANTYSGATTITDGIIEAGAANVMINSALTIAATKFFDMAGFSQTVTSVSGAGGVRNIRPGNNPATLTINGGGGATFSGNISQGTGDDLSVVKTGAGIQTLSGTGSDYVGDTSVLGGTLRLGTAAAVTFPTDLLVNGAGAVLDVQSFSQTVASVLLQGGGLIDRHAGVLTSTGAFALQNGTVSAVIAGNVGLNKTTAGTVTLTRDNTNHRRHDDYRRYARDQRGRGAWYGRFEHGDQCRHGPGDAGDDR